MRTSEQRDNDPTTMNLKDSSDNDLDVDDCLGPVRGLIDTHNRKGQAFDLTVLKKLIRLNHTVFKMEKIDVRFDSKDMAPLLSLLEFAAEEEVRLSLRSSASTPPDDLPKLCAAGLFDLFLCTTVADMDAVGAWQEARIANAVPLRVQLQLPFGTDFDANAVAKLLEGAVSVNVTLSDPFEEYEDALEGTASTKVVSQMNALVRAISVRNAEVHLVGLPFCLVDEDNLPFAENNQQFHLDHQQYAVKSYRNTLQVQGLGPNATNKFVEIQLGRQTSFHNLIDSGLLPWILEKPWLYTRVWALHKISRHLNFLRHRPRPMAETLENLDAAAVAQREKEREALGPICSECRFHRICDHASEAYEAQLPGLSIKSVSGDLIVDSLHFRRARKRYYDCIDASHRGFALAQRALGVTGLRIVDHVPPTREITVDEYEIEDHMTHYMPGAIRWFSFANAELQSTVLARLKPPFTLGFTIGGGIAAQVGFSFGRHTKLVCPMLGYSHRLVLHVDAHGHYALLRDRQLVRPTEFEDMPYVPRKLGSVVEPRISIWNIDGQVVTQRLLLWEGTPTERQDTGNCKFSVVIVSTRFARRLQACLLSLAHQQGIDLSELEVIVGYVPGLDPTDDIIDTLIEAFPTLRIVRSPFTEHHAKAKGFMINESVRLALGEWIVLLDSDILLPPRFFCAFEGVSDSEHFVAPAGRLMLSPSITARILLGQLKPWDEYDALLTCNVEYRHEESDGIPPGFCQCVRRAVFDKIQYQELDHFEGADWHFSTQVIEQFGKEHRIANMKVLHLDHAGSQWFGTDKQL